MRSIAFKLTLAFLIIGLTGAVLVAVILHQRTRTAFNQFILNRDQQVLVTSLVEYYQANGSWEGVVSELQAIIDYLPRSNDSRRDFRRDWAYFTLVGPDRTVLVSTQADQIGTVLATRDLDRAVPLKADGKTAGWVFLTPITREWIPNSPEAIFLATINRATLLSASVAAALALILGGLLAYTLTRSLKELTEATNEIAHGHFGMQVKVRSKDELGELAASFNQMSRDLAQATQARRQMTADIAHDLRSPLSVISGYAEALSDGKLPGGSDVYQILHQETQHLSRLVEDLRILSLADAGELPLNLQRTAPLSLLERAAARYAVAAQQQGVSIRVDASQVIPPVGVDVERMAQVFDNLITNAFRHMSHGGEIFLAAKAVNGTVQLQVEDTGTGIDPADLPYIFDRFYRGDKARQQSGESGLGLAIVKSIVEAHGGTITADSAPGQGARFTISLSADSSGAVENRPV